MQAGVRDLKNNLSRYLRRVSAGERIAVTAHGRVLAELIPPGSSPGGRLGPYERQIAAGTITPAAETGDPLRGPDIRLPRGTASELIDAGRSDE